MSPAPTDEIVWEAPPEIVRRNNYTEFVEKLKRSPGRWARIRTFPAHSSAYGARKTFLKTAKDERFEAVAASVDGATDLFGLWVRYRTPEQMRE